MWYEQKSGTRSDSRVCHWCSYHILTSSVIYHYWTDARQHWIYLFYTITKQTTTDKTFLFQNISAKAGLWPLTKRAELSEHEKKAIWRNLLSIQNEAISLVAMRSEELWLVQENHVTVKLSNLTQSSVASRGMKTYSESRIELQNLQILQKMLTKSSQFLSSEEPVSRKAWMLPCWKLRLRSA